MDEVVGQSRLMAPAGESVRLPVGHMVCNQTPPVGDKPSLMTFRVRALPCALRGHSIIGPDAAHAGCSLPGSCWAALLLTPGCPPTLPCDRSAWMVTGPPLTMGCGLSHSEAARPLVGETTYCLCDVAALQANGRLNFCIVQSCPLLQPAGVLRHYPGLSNRLMHWCMSCARHCCQHPHTCAGECRCQ